MILIMLLSLLLIQLPGPFDISSKTQIHQVDLTTIGVEDDQLV